jgi:hypothetical protein
LDAVAVAAGRRCGVKKLVQELIIREVAALAECAFRRGYQHGYYAALGKIGYKPTEEQVSEFRHDKWRFVRSWVGPHEWREGECKEHSGHRHNLSAVNRLWFEAEPAKAPIIKAMIEKLFGRPSK